MLEKSIVENSKIAKEDLVKFHFSSLISQIGELPRTIRTAALMDRTADLYAAFMAVLNDFNELKNEFSKDN